MKKIKFEDLSHPLTPENVEVLVEMENEHPQSEEWKRIAGKLPFDDYQKIRNCRSRSEKKKSLNGLDKLIDMKRFAEEG